MRHGNKNLLLSSSEAVSTTAARSVCPNVFSNGSRVDVCSWLVELGLVCHGCLCCLGSQSIQKEKKEEFVGVVYSIYIYIWVRKELRGVP